MSSVNPRIQFQFPLIWRRCFFRRDRRLRGIWCAAFLFITSTSCNTKTEFQSIRDTYNQNKVAFEQSFSEIFKYEAVIEQELAPLNQSTFILTQELLRSNEFPYREMKLTRNLWDLIHPSDIVVKMNEYIAYRLPIEEGNISWRTGVIAKCISGSGCTPVISTAYISIIESENANSQTQFILFEQVVD